MGTNPLGVILIVAGLGLLVVGLLVYFFGGAPFSWMGRLPGDIRVGNENYRFYFPIMTSIILSIILTLILFIINRLK
jgi:hypothetical protein